MYFIIDILLLIASTLVIILSKSYLSIPAYELKRKSKLGDRLSKNLYSVASYQNIYRLFNKILILVFSTSFYIITIAKTSSGVAFLLVFLFTLLIFFWLPRTKASRLSDYLANIFSKPMKFILSYFNPIVLKFWKSANANKRYDHTGVFEDSDIYHFIDQQKSQEDNRVDDYALDVIKSVLEFSKLRVLDAMTPKRKVKSVQYDDSLGPVILTELHESGHHYFPVYKDQPSDIVGILNIDLLASKQSPKVNQVLDEKVMYTHEDQELKEVLQIMIKANKQMFIVINSKGDYCGVITTKDVIKALVGETVVDDLDMYENKDLILAKYKERQD